mmetsp:Transcript_138482/g.386299  ORF Transcript_138482/g.386299 Transcript_138482/m.386299 type:complete len:209 (+) Transcript_138482:1-627(+)
MGSSSWVHCCCLCRSEKDGVVAADAPVVAIPEDDNPLHTPRTLSAWYVEASGSTSSLVRSLTDWYKTELRSTSSSGQLSSASGGEQCGQALAGSSRGRLMTLSWWYDGRADVPAAAPGIEGLAEAVVLVPGAEVGGGGEGEAGESGGEDDTEYVSSKDRGTTSWWLDGKLRPSGETENTEVYDVVGTQSYDIAKSPCTHALRNVACAS